MLFTDVQQFRNIFSLYDMPSPESRPFETSWQYFGDIMSEGQSNCIFCSDFTNQLFS